MPLRLARLPRRRRQRWRGNRDQRRNAVVGSLRLIHHHERQVVLTQELELILASVETQNPSKDDILSLISGTPSIRYSFGIPILLPRRSAFKPASQFGTGRSSEVESFGSKPAIASTKVTKKCQ